MGLIFDVNSSRYCWKKSDCLKLSDHFTTDEFTCPCTHADCVDQYLYSDMVEGLELTRTALGVPITITSGYRCKKHQADIKASGAETAVGTSQHELGGAGDLKAKGFTGSQLEAVAKRFFKAIGVAATWIHVDRRMDKVRRWTYVR